MFSVAELWRKQQAENPELPHLFIGCHDVQVSPPRDEQSTLPCPEDEGGPRGTSEAGYAHGQAGLAVHDLGQGQRQAGPGHHSQPLVNQGAASDAAGGGQPAAELAGDANSFQLHPAPRAGDHQCHGPLPYRCHAQGQPTLSRFCTGGRGSVCGTCSTGRLRPARAKRSPAELRVMGMLKALS